MNSPRAYRKWLRKTAQDLHVTLFIQQLRPPSSTTITIICVGILADDQVTIGTFLKRWRTTKVDVDSKGKPCLERKMRILVEGKVEAGFPSQRIIDGGIQQQEQQKYNHQQEEATVTVSSAHDMLQWIYGMGGQSWRQVANETLFQLN
jgi:hypothetical protein